MFEIETKNLKISEELNRKITWYVGLFVLNMNLYLVILKVLKTRIDNLNKKV